MTTIYSKIVSKTDGVGCQISGEEIYLPNEWLEKDVFGENEFFLCVVDLSKVVSELLPKKGFLYFFIDAPSAKYGRFKPAVRYYQDEADAVTSFNDGFEFAPLDLDDSLNLDFSDNGFPLMLCGEKEGKILLLNLPKELLSPLSSKVGFSFYIDKKSLEKRDFGKTELTVEL